MRNALLLFLVSSLLVGCAPAARFEAKINLPLRPKLKLAGQEKLALAPFLVGTRAKDEKPDTDLDLDREFRRYLEKQLQRKTKLQVAPPIQGIRLPSADAVKLAAAVEFWRSLAERSQADLVVAGLIDFDVEDRSGYRREEYVSPIDGRTYSRQVLVEETGYGFDIELWVIDGKTGALLHKEPMKAFRTEQGRGRDELEGLFENLYTLETELLSVFVSRKVEAKRFVFH